MRRARGRGATTEPESHTLTYLRQIDEKLDRQHAETGARLDRIEDELLVLNDIALRLEGRQVETTGLKAGGLARESQTNPRIEPESRA